MASGLEEDLDQSPIPGHLRQNNPQENENAPLPGFRSFGGTHWNLRISDPVKEKGRAAKHALFAKILPALSAATAIAAAATSAATAASALPASAKTTAAFAAGRFRTGFIHVQDPAVQFGAV